jgi:fatty acyl-CoA reductase
MDPIVLNFGKGHLSGFVANPDFVFDMVGSLYTMSSFV